MGQSITPLEFITISVKNISKQDGETTVVSQKPLWVNNNDKKKKKDITNTALSFIEITKNTMVTIHLSGGGQAQLEQGNKQCNILLK